VLAEEFSCCCSCSSAGAEGSVVGCLDFDFGSGAEI
jgi:hypothetical protein